MLWRRRPTASSASETWAARGSGDTGGGLRELLDRVSVELDPKARPLRNAQPAAFEDQLVNRQLLAEPRLTQLGGQELEERHVRRDRCQMCRGRDRDARF